MKSFTFKFKNLSNLFIKPYSLIYLNAVYQHIVVKGVKLKNISPNLKSNLKPTPGSKKLEIWLNLKICSIVARTVHAVEIKLLIGPFL